MFEQPKISPQVKESIAMTPRERFIAALERRPVPGLVPHFELVFYLTMEAFGKVHPSQRHYAQWVQMSETERQLHRREIAQLYVDTAERYGHSAIFLHPNPSSDTETLRLIDGVRAISGDKYFLMLHGDATAGIPDGDRMTDYSYRLFEEADKVHAESQAQVDKALARGERLRKKGGLDGFALCSDYCLNTGPFLSPKMFSKFITPYLKKLVKGYRDQGYYVIKHTDGNIMPIVEDLVSAEPHALHSLDPQAGVDMKTMVEKFGDRVCLIGNVNCGLLDTGTEAEVAQSTRYAIENGLKAPGYIFSTSNCIYTGMDLKRYELMLDIWRKEAVRRV